MEKIRMRKPDILMLGNHECDVYTVTQVGDEFIVSKTGGTFYISVFHYWEEVAEYINMWKEDKFEYVRGEEFGEELIARYEKSNGEFS